eukprot:bmy_18726T0
MAHQPQALAPRVALPCQVPVLEFIQKLRVNQVSAFGGSPLQQRFRNLSSCCCCAVALQDHTEAVGD